MAELNSFQMKEHVLFCSVLFQLNKRPSCMPCCCVIISDFIKSYVKLLYIDHAPLSLSISN